MRILEKTQKKEFIPKFTFEKKVKKLALEKQDSIEKDLLNFLKALEKKGLIVID